MGKKTSFGSLWAMETMGSTPLPHWVISVPTVTVARVELRRASLVEICHADEALRSCPLLGSLAPEEEERLLGGSVARRYAGGAAVYREGDEGCAAFLVLRGEVSLSSGRNVVF